VDVAGAEIVGGFEPDATEDTVTADVDVAGAEIVGGFEPDAT